MIFDPSISIGTILNIVGLVVAAFTLYSRTSRTLTIFEMNYKNATSRLDKIEDEIDRLTRVTEVIALQKERLLSIDKRVDEISADMKERFKTFLSIAEIQNMIADSKKTRTRKT